MTSSKSQAGVRQLCHLHHSSRTCAREDWRRLTWLSPLTNMVSDNSKECLDIDDEDDEKHIEEPKAEFEPLMKQLEKG